MEKICKALNLRECPLCFDVLESQCSKKKCQSKDGELPKMINVTAKKDKVARGKKRKCNDERCNESDENSDDNDSDESDNGIVDYGIEDYTLVKSPRKKCSYPFSLSCGLLPCLFVICLHLCTGWGCWVWMFV